MGHTRQMAKRGNSSTETMEEILTRLQYLECRVKSLESEVTALKGVKTKLWAPTGDPPSGGNYGGYVLGGASAGKPSSFSFGAEKKGFKFGAKHHGNGGYAAAAASGSASAMASAAAAAPAPMEESMASVSRLDFGAPSFVPGNGQYTFTDDDYDDDARVWES
jgi:hypothetical protein